MPSSSISTAPASLELRGLTKAYVRGGTPALNGVSHSFAPGKVTVVLGPSGSGKSTVLGAISGLVPPDTGGVWLDGRDITELAPEKRGFGMVFQNYALFPHLSVVENVEFGLRVRGLGREERRTQALEMLHLTRIPHLAGRRVHEISGGEQQRVAVARALAVRPTVLLMDEPLSALDARLRDDLRAELARLLRELALTTVYVTHDQAEAMSLGHELLVMQRGRIEQAGRAEDLYLRPASPFVAGFIGAANVFAGVERLSDGTVRLPFANLPAESDVPPGPCWAMLRPESFELVRDSGRADFTAVPEAIFFLGAQVRAQLRIGEQPLTAEFPAGTPLEPGRPLALRVRPGGLYVRAAENGA
ncbi:MAG: ABC transporter ATP-binding protein [Verrucomicrobia bacterium]|nr:ABC transporter ATP-binding protein [Verrucomicrobiota bacterium]